MAQSCAWHWFWALTSWEFFLAKRTFHQVMPIFIVPRDPPLKISCPEIVVDDLLYAIGSFEHFFTAGAKYIGVLYTPNRLE